ERESSARRAAHMRIHQAGNYSERVSANQINDWSWAQTMRRVAVLARLAAPYRRRVLGGVAALLIGTAAALAPPYLAKVAIDEGILGKDTQVLGIIAAVFVAVAVVGWLAGMAQTYLTSWVGERVLADLRLRLFRHLGRLSLGFY